MSVRQGETLLKQACSAIKKLALVGAVAVAPHAFVQNATPNLNKFVITGSAAKKALSISEISGKTARKLADACEGYALQNGVSVAITFANRAGEAE